MQAIIRKRLLSTGVVIHDATSIHALRLRSTFHKQRIPFTYQQRASSQAAKDGSATAKDGQTNKRTRSAFEGKTIGVVILAAGAAFAYNYTQSSEQEIFDPPRFTPFTITQREEVSSTSIILTLRPQNTSRHEAESDPYSSCWQKGTWSVEVKQPQLQIARAYTPLPPREGDRNGDLRLLIRKERNGEVSGYLHGLQVGEVVQMRGPRTELELTEDLTDVVFLAGGTGIAPAMQVAYTLLEKREGVAPRPNVKIIWANRKREDCLGGGQAGGAKGTFESGQIVKELTELHKRHPNQLSVEYVVDEERTFLEKKRIAQATQLSSRVAPLAAPASSHSRLLILSGPDGFITHFAGKKLWDGGEGGQGQIGGVIGSIALKDWKVWKL